MAWRPVQMCVDCGKRPRAVRFRCRPCARAADHRRGNRQSRGHGADYTAVRAALLADHPSCYWGCGRPATTADYRRPWSKGGTLADLVPACGHCNYARGNRAGPPP